MERRRFLVTRVPGPNWTPRAPLGMQPEWEAHAAYLTDLANRGLLLMGGPVEQEEEIIVVTSADNEAEIRAAFAEDPWEKSGVIETRDIRPWTVMLESKG